MPAHSTVTSVLTSSFGWLIVRLRIPRRSIGLEQRRNGDRIRRVRPYSQAWLVSRPVGRRRQQSWRSDVERQRIHRPDWSSRGTAVSWWIDAMRRAATVSFPPSGSSPASTRRRSSAARRPSPVILSMLSSDGSNARLRTRSARGARSATPVDQRVARLDHHRLGLVASEPWCREVQVFGGADVGDLPVEGEQLRHVLEVGKRVCMRYELPSGASSSAVWVRPKVAAHESNARRSTSASRSGCR